MRIHPGSLRFVRYSLVGVGTFAIDLALLYVATSIIGIPYYISTPCAFLIAVSINYSISRRFVFGKTERTWHHGYMYFASVAIAGAMATTSLVAFLVSVWGLYYLTARVIVAGVVGIGNYLFNLFINFKVVGKH
jgi:putative flippase GtrA